MKIYLAHPWLEKDRGELLQRSIEALGIEVINPFEREKKIYGKLFDPLKATEQNRAQTIVEGDLRAIEESDGVVAIVTEALSYGTHMETFYAARILHRPVFVLLE